MRKIILGFLLGFLISTSVAFGFRLGKPQRIVKFDDNALIIINDNFERLWDLTNGKYSPNNGSTASTGNGTVKMGNGNSANSAGWFKFDKTDGTIVYVPYWTTENP